MTELISPKNPAGIGYFELLGKIQPGLANSYCISETNVFDYNPCWWIRHDIDHSLKHALEMAVAESCRNYNATYFFLHTAEYWTTSWLWPVVQAIHKEGHDIGLHNNAIAESHRTGKPAIDIFDDARKRLEDIVGERIRITSAHGDKLCYEKGFLNYDLWKEYDIEKRGMTEAYFTRRDAYLTDSGHKWRGWVGAESMPPFEAFDNHFGAEETIERFNEMDSGVLQLLVHPCWWEVA